jgi:flagellar basal body-associated protein FliL
MKKRLYIIILSILAIVIVSTAFIPLTNNFKKENRKRDANVVQIHPEAGYIEKIGD